MFVAMQIYKEGDRTFFNKVSSREYKTKEAAVKCAKAKAKGIPYVVQGSDVVWTPFGGLHDKKSIRRFASSSN